MLKFIFTSIFEIEIHEKKFLGTKKISFPKADFDGRNSTPTAWDLSFIIYKKMSTMWHRRVNWTFLVIELRDARWIAYLVINIIFF